MVVSVDSTSRPRYAMMHLIFAGPYLLTIPTSISSCNIYCPSSLISYPSQTSSHIDLGDFFLGFLPVPDIGLCPVDVASSICNLYRHVVSPPCAAKDVNAYHVSLQVIFFFQLEPFKILQNPCTCILDVFLRHFECLFELGRLSVRGPAVLSLMKVIPGLDFL